MPSTLPDIGPERIDYNAIKARINLVDYIGQHTELRPAGSTFKGKCPLPGHDDSSPSLVVYPYNNTWWCFGCQRGSDIYDYVRFMFDMKPSELARG